MSKPTDPSRALSRLAALVVAVVAVAASSVSVVPAHAGPVPSPLPWERVYEPAPELSIEDAGKAMLQQCQQTQNEGLRQNTSSGPRIGVLGDSVENQLRQYGLADPAFHWISGTHCGEHFRSAIDEGRAGAVLAQHPDVLVIGTGANDLTKDFMTRPEMLPAAIDGLNALLDATSGVRCRVLVNQPRIPITWTPPATHAAYTTAMAGLDAAFTAAQARPGVHVADLATLVESNPTRYTFDGLHLTHAGINARLNLELATARQCLAPDTPGGLAAAGGFQSATLWWDRLPDLERVNYVVELSDGRKFLAWQNLLSVGGLTNGVAYRFRVQAVNEGGAGELSAWSAPFTPSAAGARFHSLAPMRVLDTRTGQGGKQGPFAGDESFRLSVANVVPAGASAVVVNLTATDQTQQGFVTTWPGDQPRPLASNLNPRPGVAAVPAMATVRLAPDRTIGLYNSIGRTHLLADVVGYYDAPGTTTGALYAPVAPTRLLDTRTGQGNKSGPFDRQETFDLAVPVVPTDATAVVLNVTSTDTSNAGFVTLWPTGQARPLASNLNPQPGLTRANLTVSRLGTGRSVSIHNNSPTTNLVVDLVGYYTAEGAPGGGSLYYPTSPQRLYDTRVGIGGRQGPVSNATNLDLDYAGRGTIPTTGVTAVDANLTVTDPTQRGHATIWPGGDRPTSSNLNYDPAEIIANRDHITLSSGRASLWSTSPTINYIIDANGWFGPAL